MEEQPGTPGTAVADEKSTDAEEATSVGYRLINLFAGVFLTAISLAATAILTSFFPSFGVIIYAISLLVSLLGLSYFALGKAFGHDDEISAAVGAGWFLLFFVFGFGQLCRFINLNYGGFTGHATGYWGWSLYGVSWVLDNFTANLGQIFGWNVTDIEPISFGARAITWAFNICLDAFAVAAFLRYAPTLLGRRHR